MEMEMEMASSLTHVMVVSFSAQGHINPLLRFGKLLATKGLLVTFVTTEELCGRKMRQANKIQQGVVKPVGSGFLRFEFIDDGFSLDDLKINDKTGFDEIQKKREAASERELKKLVNKYDEERVSVTCIVNDAFVPWVCDVAEQLQIPSAVLWVQSSACLAAYYYYHHKLVQFPTKTDPEVKVEFPFKPFMLKHDEIPTLLSASPRSVTFGELALAQIERLDKSFYLLIDTFQELERDIIDHLSHLCPKVIIKPVGSLFMMGKSKTLTSDIKGDIFEAKDHCMEWLDSREPNSVVYISFGTVVHLKQEQIDEIAQGLLNSGLSFLWAVRPPMEGFNLQPYVFPTELKEKGKIVEWCPQEKVLAHPAVSCFLSHCGWNSTMEALSSGVPMVCFPQCGDQVTNAVYMVDVFKAGVRLGRGEAEERIISREVVAEKIVEATVGKKAVELRENARMWKQEAEAAVACGGSSDKNLQVFVDNLVGLKDNAKQ